MRTLVERLVAEELRRGGEADSQRGRAAFRICEKLRRPLSTYAGAAGFQSLLSRALSVAKVEQPWLSAVQIMPDGSITFSPEAEEQMATESATAAGAALVAHLLVLLATFIGEALTLRLVQDVWPNVAVGESKPRGKQK